MEPNEELIRRFLDAQTRGDAALLNDLLADDIVWHVPGRNLLSRDYAGKTEVFGFFGRARELSGGTVRIETDRDGRATSTLSRSSECTRSERAQA